MMRILDRYVLKLYLQSFLVSAIFILGLFVVIDFFSKIDEFLDPGAIHAANRSVLGVALEFYLLSVPTNLAIVAPFITLMAAMWTVARLVRQNELVSIVGAGVSVRRALLPVFAVAALVTGGMAAGQQWVIPEVAVRQRALERLIKGKDPSIVTGTSLRDGRGNLIRIERFDPVRNRAFSLDATVKGNLPGQVKAKEAEYGDGPNGVGWYLEGGERQVFDANGKFTVAEHRFFDETDVVPSQILLANADPVNLSYTQLIEAARHKPDDPRYRVYLYHHVTTPLANLVLLLLGLPFALRQRARNPFLAIAMCILICAAFYAADFVCKDVGQRGELNPLIASFLPVAIFGAAGIAMFDSVRT